MKKSFELTQTIQSVELSGATPNFGEILDKNSKYC